MPIYRRLCLPVVVCSALLLVGLPALAQEPPDPAGGSPPPIRELTPPQGQRLSVAKPDHNAEVSFFVGGLVGGDLGSLISGDFSLRGTLDNGRAYGGRVGYYRWPIGVEGSLAYSNSGLAAEANLQNATFQVAARVIYAEANALLILIPGPVQPFVTGGGGLHAFKLTDLQGIEVRKWGWNFGGGVKANIKRVSLRADVRDHLTRLQAGDLGVDQELAALLGIGEQDLHNVEVSFGVGFRF